MSARNQFLMDIMTTAVEGGIDYWAAVRNLKRDDELNVVSFEVRDAEDSSEPWQEINSDKLEAALTKVTADSSLCGSVYRDCIVADNAVNDMESMDADCADIIVQVAAFGEVVFG